MMKKAKIESPGWVLALLLLMSVAGGLLLWLSLVQLKTYKMITLDIVAIGQAIWRAAEAEGLIYTHRGVPINRLAKHVEFFYFLLAPFYRLWPRPETLLTAQSLLFVLGAVPVYRLARRRLQSGRAGWLMALIYLFYPVAQTAVLFEFHADTLAVPWLLLAIDALDRRRWRAYGFWLFLALICKFYVAVPVGAMGLLLWWRGQRRAGLLTMLAAGGWFLFTFFGVRAWFTPAEAVAETEATISGYIRYYFQDFFALGDSWLPRLANGVLVYTPALLLGWRAWPWLAVASTVILPVLVSSGPGPAYLYTFHHYALAVPFLMAAVIYGAEQLKETQAAATSPRRAANWQVGVLFTAVITLLINGLAVNKPANPLLALVTAGSTIRTGNSAFGASARDQMKDAWLAEFVPPSAPLAADASTSVRLYNREKFYVTQPLYTSLPMLLPQLDYVVTDLLFDYAAGETAEIANAEFQTAQAVLPAAGWQVLQMRDGLVLFAKTENGLAQNITFLPREDERPLTAVFGDMIGLQGCALMPLRPYEYQMQCDWVALQPVPAGQLHFAVSQPEGLPQARILHLPTLGLAAPHTWPQDSLVRETFTFTLPPDTPPGQYPLWLSWHDGRHPHAALTDERSRLGEPAQIGVLAVP